MRSIYDIKDRISRHIACPSYFKQAFAILVFLLPLACYLDGCSKPMHPYTAINHELKMSTVLSNGVSFVTGDLVWPDCYSIFLEICAGKISKHEV